MLRVASSLIGYDVEASDGDAGSVHDILFDDITWKIRWLVIDTGGWLSGRRVLIHPSAVSPLNLESSRLQVNLSRLAISEAPGSLLDRPVSQQQEKSLYDYYDWDPAWGGSYFGQGTMVADLEPVMYFDQDTVRGAAGNGFHLEAGDPHLRSLSEVKGYHVHANDGDIGHVQDVLLDDAKWLILYVIIDTKNWWVGQHVLISPYAVTHLEYPDQKIRVDTTMAKIRSSPPWKPEELIDELYQAKLHHHYNWPKY